MNKENTKVQLIAFITRINSKLIEYEFFDIPEFEKSINILSIKSSQVDSVKVHLSSGFRRLYEMGIYDNEIEELSENIYALIKDN